MRGGVRGRGSNPSTYLIVMLKSQKKKPFNLLALNYLKITIFFESTKFC